MSDATIVLGVACALNAVVGGGLIAWRWYLDDRKAARVHEFALQAKRVEVDEQAVAEDRAKLRKLTERVTSLEYAASRK